MKTPPKITSTWRDLDQPEFSLLDEVPRRQERSKVLGTITEYLTVSVFVLTIMAYQWIHWLFKWEPHPLIFSVIGGCLIGYAIIRICMMIPRLNALKLEAASARNYQNALQQLSARGWYVFHRVNGGENNHLGTMIVGPAGVYCLTARHISRLGDAPQVIEEGTDGSLTLGGTPLLGNPQQQAQRATMQAYHLLSKAGLDTISIQPVLVFPSWRIVSPHEANPVWVLNENLLLQRLSDLPSVLEPKQVIELCTLLERYAAS